METIEKVRKVLNSAIRDDNNKLYILPLLFEDMMFGEEESVIREVKEKAQKLVDMVNVAEENNDIEFLHKDYETEVYPTL